MRKEATLEQWKKLYDIATEIHLLEPWYKLSDSDLIEVCSDKHEPVYFSTLGMLGTCYGINIFEGEEGLRGFLCMMNSERLGLRDGEAMLNYNSMVCYWGNRDELSKKQWQRIKDMGFRYRGENAWLYFMSIVPGYFPYDLDKDEVERMTVYLSEYLLALNMLDNSRIEPPFDDFCVFKLDLKDGGKRFEYGIAEMTNTTFPIEIYGVDDDSIRIMKTRKNLPIKLEVEMKNLNSYITDKKYDRPPAIRMTVLADADSWFIFNAQIEEPENQWPAVYLAAVTAFIMDHGIPKEIHVPDMIAEGALKALCGSLNIKLRVRRQLDAIESFFENAPF